MSSSENEGDSSSSSPARYNQNTLNVIDTTNTRRGGLLAGVISFVSREITDFVVTATGGTEVLSFPHSASGAYINDAIFLSRH